MTDTQAILTDLARVKVISQMRAIAAHLGIPHPSTAAPLSAFAHGRPDAVHPFRSVGACPLPEPIGQPLHVEREERRPSISDAVCLGRFGNAGMVDQHTTGVNP